MITLREAAKQALEWLDEESWPGFDEWVQEGRAIRNSLRAALAEPQEPVAWRYKDTGHFTASQLVSKFPEWQPLYTHPAPQRQPLTADETMHLMNETAGHYWADEAHIQRFRAAVEKRHGIGGQDGQV